jgi:diaminopimelate decarboxylase
MSLVRGILRAGRLGRHAPADLAARFGTPYYAYDLDVITRQVGALRAAMPDAFDLSYAVKANPNLAVLRHIAGLGLGADVASGGELRHVLRAGFTPDRVVFTGPGKRDEELRAAVEAGVQVVTVESTGELRRLAAIAEGLGRRQPVLLRAAVASVDAIARCGPAGVDITRKFGMDARELRTAAADAVASPWLEPLGLHAFGASNVTDAAVLATHAEATVEAAMAVAASAGFELRLVDAGGGLGIPYADGDTELDLEVLGARLVPLARRMAALPASRGARVILEPGRFLVGAAGAYVVRVLDRKPMGGQEVVIVDGGIHHLLRPVLVGQEQRVVALTGRTAAATGAATPRDAPVVLAGPLCTGLDVFAHAANMAAPDVGDLVGVLEAGAYGATESMPFFLSHPLPPEVVLRGDEAWLARPRVEPEAWLDWQTAGPPAA